MKTPFSSLTRRRFLKTACITGAALTLAGPGPFKVLNALAASGRMRTEQQSRLLMGTVVALTVATSDPALAEIAFDEAFAEMERLIAVFDRHDPGTALGLLNRQGSLASGPQELTLVLKEALRLGGRTGNAFNPSIAPVVDLFDAVRSDAFKRGALDGAGLPGFAGKELKAALELARPGGISISDSGIRLERSGMRLTLDGIAKGYIADQASRVLASRKLPNHMVNAGGDIRVSGKAASGKAWTIGIQHPANPGGLLDAVAMSDGALATSGSYEKYYNRARTRHHLINSLTGKSGDIASVTVRDDSAMQADALATALALMSPAQAVRYVENRTGAACLLLDDQGRRHASSNWS